MTERPEANAGSNDGCLSEPTGLAASLPPATGSALPCPFCGGAAKIFTREIHDTTPEPRRKLYWYVCNTYQCGVGVTHGEWTDRRALEKWNRRTPAPNADPRRSLDEIVRLRDRTSASLHHWGKILEDTEYFRSPTIYANAKEQIVWIQGYLRALDDVMQANSKVSRVIDKPKI